jgi:type IV pilus assembly protein PilQ
MTLIVERTGIQWKRSAPRLRYNEEKQEDVMAIASLVLTVFLASPQAVSLDLSAADLKDFLMIMGKSANLNVVLHPSVQGSITLNVRDAPWETLLDMVLRNYGLTRETEGNLMRIVPVSVIEAELRQRAAAEDARLAAQPLETRTYILNYARAADVAPIVSNLLSPRGMVIVDERRNALIVRDVVP